MSIVNPEQRQRLAGLQGRVRESRSRLHAAEAEARKLVENENADRDEILAARDAVGSARAEYQRAQELENALLGQIAGVVAGGSAGVGGSFLDDPAMVSTLQQLGRTTATPIGNMPLGQFCSAEQIVDQLRSGRWGSGGSGVYGADSVGGLVDTTVGGGAARLGPWYGMLPQLRRRLRVLDVINKQTMLEGSSFKYTQELGSFDTAAETAELSAKPTADVDYEDAEVVAQTIAHWFKASRQSLADVPQLTASLDSRLMYGVYRRVENQILAGDGTGQNLKGILNTTGIADVAYTAGDPLTDLTLDAITDVIVSDAEPNAVVANPVDVATMLKAKSSGSGERLDSNGAFATPPAEMWGLPLIQTPAMGQGQALVGDFAQGATLWVREGVTIRASDSDQDDFIKNRMTLLGEGRFGLSVERPVCFALVHFS